MVANLWTISGGAAFWWFLCDTTTIIVTSIRLHILRVGVINTTRAGPRWSSECWTVTRKYMFHTVYTQSMGTLVNIILIQNLIKYILKYILHTVYCEHW